MKKICLCLISLASLFSLSGCVKKVVQTTGERITNTYYFSEYISSLEIRDIYLKLGNSSVLPKVNITNEGEKKVEITYEASLEKIISIEKIENTLLIKGKYYEEFISKGVIINITGFKFDELDLKTCECKIDNYSLNSNINCSIELSGASELKIDSYSFLQELDLDLSGASSLVANRLSINKLDLGLSGASEMKVESINVTTFESEISGASSIYSNNGIVKELDLDLSGSSDFLFEKVNVDTARVNISWASKANLTVTNLLSGNISGASSLIYSGDINPNLSVSGGSVVTKK